jgi:hypothetical protein
MAELNTIRLLTGYIDDINSKRAEDGTLDVLTNDYLHGTAINKADAISGFAKEHSMSEPVVNKVCTSAEKFGYLQTVPHLRAGEGERIIVTPDKGLNLIQTRWLIPTGLIRASLDENKGIISVLGLIAAIIVCIATVVNVAILASPKSAKTIQGTNQESFVAHS